MLEVGQKPKHHSSLGTGALIRKKTLQDMDIIDESIPKRRFFVLYQQFAVLTDGPIYKYQKWIEIARAGIKVEHNRIKGGAHAGKDIARHRAISLCSISAQFSIYICASFRLSTIFMKHGRYMKLISRKRGF